MTLQHFEVVALVEVAHGGFGGRPQPVGPAMVFTTTAVSLGLAAPAATIWLHQRTTHLIAWAMAEATLPRIKWANRSRTSGV